MRVSLSISLNLRGIKIAGWHGDATILQVGQELRANAGGLEVALDGTVLRRAGAIVAEYLLHLDHITFDARHLAHRHHLALQAAGIILNLG